MMHGKVLTALVFVGSSMGAREARAQQWLLSANENKVGLVDGVTTVQSAPAPDNLTLFDVAGKDPRLVAQLELPTSVVGPAGSVALAPDLSLALVSAASRIDPADKSKLTDGNQLTVIDLQGTPAVVQTLTVGPAPSGVALSPNGKLALAVTRTDSSVLVFAIENKRLRQTARLALPDKSVPGSVAFTPDGKRALVTRDGDNAVTVLAIEGDQVALAGRDFHTGLRPYGLAIAPDGKWAVIGNVGKGQGDADTVALVELADGPLRTVHQLTVGPTVEGIAIAPDGKLVAAVVQNGSNRPTSSPFHHDRGYVVLLRVERDKLVQLASAPVGKWPQGAAFSADSRQLFVQNMVERELQLFRIEAQRRLIDTGRRVPLPGGGAALTTGAR